MSGSVVVTTAKQTIKGGKKPKSQAKKKAKAAPKAKAANMPSSGAAQLPTEVGVEDPTVAVSHGVRNKLWVDDCFNSIGHAMNALLLLPKYSSADPACKPDLERSLLRMALQFALKGQVTVQSMKGAKKYSKWSALRPALQARAAELLASKASNFPQFLA